MDVFQQSHQCDRVQITKLPGLILHVNLLIFAIYRQTNTEYLVKTIQQLGTTDSSYHSRRVRHVVLSLPAHTGPEPNNPTRFFRLSLRRAPISSAYTGPIVPPNPTATQATIHNSCNAFLSIDQSFQCTGTVQNPSIDCAPLLATITIAIFN